MTSKRFTQGGLVVPFIAPWTAEVEVRSPLTVKGGRLAYADEIPSDRDQWGVLWHRKMHTPGRGHAKFRGVHSHRQRQAVFRSLCQVGGGPVLELNEGRLLFLMKDLGEGIAEGERTWVPPICIPCAVTAVRFCPDLRLHVAVWCNYAPSWGVAGVLYDSKTLRPVGEDLVELPYDDPRTKWVIAGRLMVELRELTRVDLSSLAPGETTCEAIPNYIVSEPS